MADLGEENKVSGVFGGVEIENIGNEPENAGTIQKPENNKLVKQGFWSKFKAFISTKSRRRNKRIPTPRNHLGKST